MAFYTILTAIGKAKLANATALGTVVDVTEIAVGDGGGTPITLDETDTALTNEVWRAALNGISIDANNANWIVAEGYIPSTAGGFTVREVALFDVDGDMIVIGNYPDTYKPTLASGSAKDLYIKVVIEVSNADVVELKIDPAVVLASREYVDSEVLKRALVNGSAAELFKVKAGVADDEAVNKAQMEASLAGVGGKVLQVVSVTKKDTFSTTSTTFVDVTGLTATITPAKATNKILVMLTTHLGHSNNGYPTNIQLLRGDVPISVGDLANLRSQSTGYANASHYTDLNNMSVQYLDNPASVIPTTYKLRMKTAGLTAYLNRTAFDGDDASYPRLSSQIVLIEIGA